VPEPDENPIDAPENQEEPITENLQPSSKPENLQPCSDNDNISEQIDAWMNENL